LIALSGLATLEENGTIPKPEATDSVNGWKSSQIWHAMIEMIGPSFIKFNSLGVSHSTSMLLSR
jgi:hypothetical protein